MSVQLDGCAAIQSWGRARRAALLTLCGLLMAGGVQITNKTQLIQHKTATNLLLFLAVFSVR